MTVQVLDADASESGPDRGTFQLSRNITTGFGGPLTVYFALDGDALNGSDYQTLEPSITFPAGVNRVTLDVTPIDDSLNEGPESVVLRLLPNPNYRVGIPDRGVITISDNDAPTVTVQATDANASESGLDPGTFTVSRTRATDASLTVHFAISGTANNGRDYHSLGNSVIIPAGETSAVVTVAPIDDNEIEGSETVILELDDLSAATNHNGGAIHFAGDGTLYVAVGENANGDNAQTLGNLLGKMLRINLTAYGPRVFHGVLCSDAVEAKR